MSDIFRFVASKTSTIISATGGLSSILNHFSATKCHCISLEEFTHNIPTALKLAKKIKLTIFCAFVNLDCSCPFNIQPWVPCQVHLYISEYNYQHVSNKAFWPKRIARREFIPDFGNGTKSPGLNTSLRSFSTSITRKFGYNIPEHKNP